MTKRPSDSARPQHSGRARAPERDAGVRFDRLLALALCLPALLLLMPLGPGAVPPLVSDPTPDATAAGWIALAALPAVALALLRGAAARALPLWLPIGVAFLAVATMRLLGAPGADTLGADRSTLGWVAGAALCTAGATLGSRGRATLTTIVVALGLALVASARWAPAAAGIPGVAGLVGNTGDLSEAALPAGVLGLGLFLGGTPPLRVLGLAAAVGSALYAGLVPVHAGTLGWISAAVCAFVCSFGRPPARRLARLALVLSFVAVAAFGVRSLTGSGSSVGAAIGAGERASDGAPDPAFGRDPDRASGAGQIELGGAPFRVATWRATLRLVAAQPLGVGPGQFQAAFPPYRDPAELERSSHGRREPTPQEVEHPHNDVLLAFAELGLLGGGLYLVFVLVLLSRALRALRGSDIGTAALGLGVFAALVNGLVNTPVLSGTVSAAVSWPLFGALLAATQGPPLKSAGALGRALRFAPYALALLLALSAQRAQRLMAHGRALSELPSARIVVDGHEQLDGAQLGVLLARALEARPDSVPALEKRAQLLAARGAPEAQQREVLERALALHPYSFSLLLALGNLAAEAQRFDEAATLYAAASAVDAPNPLLLANRLRLALEARDPFAAESALEAARRGGLVTDTELERLAAERLLRGHLEVAAVLLAAWAPAELAGSLRGDPDAGTAPRYDLLTGEAAYQASRDLREAGRDLLADGFLCAYQMSRAREHRASGAHETAVRMARQALRRAEEWPDIAPEHGALRLEYAASLVAAGDNSSARDTLAAAPIRGIDLQRMLSADRAALVGAGLVSLVDGWVVVPGPG